jgi:hypothetical protein
MMHVFVFEGLVVQILQNCNQENLPVLQLCSCVMLLRRPERHETRRDNKAPPHLFALCRAARGFAAGAGWLKEGCYALLAACLGAGIREQLEHLQADRQAGRQAGGQSHRRWQWQWHETAFLPLPDEKECSQQQTMCGNLLQAD